MQNREIRFRAWDKINGMVNEPAFMVPQAGKVGINDMLQILPNVMQYTCLKASDGVTDVYEGDIISLTGTVVGNIYESPQILEEGNNQTITSMGTEA